MSYKFQYNRPNNPAQTTRICWTVQARMKQQQTLPNPWPTQRLSRWACPAGQPLLNSPIQTPDKHLTVQSLSISWYFHTLQHYQLHILLDTVWKRIIIELLIPLHIYIYIYVLAAKPLTFQESNKHIELVSNQPKLKRIQCQLVLPWCLQQCPIIWCTAQGIVNQLSPVVPGNDTANLPVKLHFLHHSVISHRFFVGNTLGHWGWGGISTSSSKTSSCLVLNIPGCSF